MRSVIERRASAAGPRALGQRLFVAAVAGLVAWGAFAFGAVYPWAYVPLLVAAALVGAGAALAAGREMPEHRSFRLLIGALLAIALLAGIQAVPLPGAVRTVISPASESFLRDTDVMYAAALSARDAQPLSAVRSLDRPLSIAPRNTLRGAAILLALTVFLLGVTRFVSRAGAGPIASWIVALGAMLAVVGIVQKATLGDNAYLGMKIYGFWEPRYKLTTPFGPFVNKNHYAGWMLMAIPLALGYLIGVVEDGLRRVRPGWRNRLLWLSSPQGGRVQLIAFAMLLMAAALVLTMSRSGIGCFAVAMFVASLTVVRGRDTATARVALAVVLVALLAVPFLWAGVDVAGRFSSGSESIELRRQAWRDAVAIIRDFPVAGTGLDTYGVATLKYNTARTDLHFQEAHNDYLQLAAEGGLLLGIPALLSAWLALGLVRRGFADDTSRTGSWLRFGAVTGLAAIALQSMVEFSLQMPGNAVLFVVLLAIAIHRPSPLTGKAERYG